MNFYKPQMTTEEVDELFDKLYDEAVNKVVEEKEEVKPKKTNAFWGAIWDFVGFFTYKPICSLAEKLNEHIKSKIACYLLAVLGYASLILFIIF